MALLRWIEIITRLRTGITLKSLRPVQILGSIAKMCNTSSHYCLSCLQFCIASLENFLKTASAVRLVKASAGKRRLVSQSNQAIAEPCRSSRRKSLPAERLVGTKVSISRREQLAIKLGLLFFLMPPLADFRPTSHLAGYNRDRIRGDKRVSPALTKVCLNLLAFPLKAVILRINDSMRIVPRK